MDWLLLKVQSLVVLLTVIRTSDCSTYSVQYSHPYVLTYAAGFQYFLTSRSYILKKVFMIACKQRKTRHFFENSSFLWPFVFSFNDTFIHFCYLFSFFSPAILCIFIRRAWMRPLANLCLAMMHRMWSAKMKLACRMGMGLACGLVLGLWMTIFNALLSSSTPDTCMSCIKVVGYYSSTLKCCKIITFYIHNDKKKTHSTLNSTLH